MHTVLTYIWEQAVRKVIKSLRDKIFEEFARNRTSQHARLEVQGQTALSSFRNSAGTPGEMQGVLKENLTPKIRSFHSVYQVLSMDLRYIPARWPAWLRWTHTRVRGSLGREGRLFHDWRGGWSLAHPPCVHRPVSSQAPTPSSLPCSQWFQSFVEMEVVLPFRKEWDSCPRPPGETATITIVTFSGGLHING